MTEYLFCWTCGMLIPLDDEGCLDHKRAGHKTERTTLSAGQEAARKSMAERVAGKLTEHPETITDLPQRPASDNTV